MKSLFISVIPPGLLAILGMAALVFWTHLYPTQPLIARVPGLDKPSTSENGEAARPLVGKLQTFDGKASTLPSAWPRFRGEHFDGIGQPGVPLARNWPTTGPKKKWQIELGEGHAGAAIFAGRVYVHDYDRVAAADAIRWDPLESTCRHASLSIL